MTVALIAYRQLDRPQQKAIQQILKAHPHFNEFLNAKPPADADPEEWIVMQAAIWPDWVRSHHKQEKYKGRFYFHQPYHHYVNLPVKRLDGTTAEQKDEIEQNIKALPTKDESGVLLTELPNWTDKARSSKDPGERAIALCWVLHLVGDIHQPLHAAALFSKDSSAGDRGGNAAFVRWKNHATDLHTIWDGVLGWDEFVGPGAANLSEFGVVEIMARQFQKLYPVTDDQLKITSADDWAKESRDLAESEVYVSKGKPLALLFNFDKHPHISPAEVAPLPPGYQAHAQEVAERRVALAGARLVGVVRGVVSKNAE
jgi:hypothetical protein